MYFGHWKIITKLMNNPFVNGLRLVDNIAPETGSETDHVTTLPCVYRSVCTPCYKCLNVVFTFVLTDFHLEDEKKRAKTEVWPSLLMSLLFVITWCRFECNDFHCLGFVLSFVFGCTGCVCCKLFGTTVEKRSVLTTCNVLTTGYTCTCIVEGFGCSFIRKEAG